MVCPLDSVHRTVHPMLAELPAVTVTVAWNPPGHELLMTQVALQAPVVGGVVGGAVVGGAVVGGAVVGGRVVGTAVVGGAVVGGRVVGTAVVGGGVVLPGGLPMP